MKIVRRIDIRQTCKIDKIHDWVLNRKIERNQYTDCMVDERIVNVTRDKTPSGGRDVGRPGKHWEPGKRCTTDKETEKEQAILP